MLAWRAWLEANHIQQPFKQAHREIYVLTDAERQTNVYSNRLAAHILKQHQLNALCLARGWKYKPLAGYDEVETKATLDLPAWNLRAEFWIELADQVGEDMTEAGVYLYVATDQVRFYTTADDAPPDMSAQPLPLETIPPLVLSEVLRDTDLFVGVASVANDPTWADRGAEGNNRTYWTTRALDELNAPAQTRKAVLEQLVPRLKIAGRCSFTERFLAVRGTLHTYHIHLGSGNVLMKPNDQFLCIVPGRSMSESLSEIFLPFEGDSMLSIILSKAFLLADDTKISDASITSQLKR